MNESSYSIKLLLEFIISTSKAEMTLDSMSVEYIVGCNQAPQELLLGFKLLLTFSRNS